MELSEENFHDIHQYLSGKGTPRQREDFERRMDADPDLARETDTQRRIRDGLRANEYKKMFQALHTQMASDGTLPSATGPGHQPSDNTVVPLSGTDKPRKAYSWSLVAAAAASIVIATGLVWYFNDRPQTLPVATTPPVTQPAPSVDTVMSSGPAIAVDSANASPKPTKKKKSAPKVVLPDYFARYFNADAGLKSPFSKEKFGISPSAFRQWQADTAHVQSGIRHLLQQQGGKALDELNQVRNSRFTQVKNAAEWYAALALVQQHDWAGCRTQLQKIVDNPESDYQARAVELLREIQ